MPQHPTLSLSNFLNSAASSSRKRSHAEITRSQSRSISPDLPSKRRRVSPSANSSLFSSPSPTPPTTSTSTLTRTARHGYDYRQPVMSSNTSRPSQAPNELTIDLTVDSESDGGSPPDRDASPRRPVRHNPQTQTQPQARDGRTTGAPPFGIRPRQETHEVIALSDDSDFQAEDFDAGTDLVSDDESDPVPDSPEVQIVHERPALPDDRRPQSARPPNRRPSPQHAERGPWVNLPDFIRRGTQFMFGNVQNVNDVFLDRLDGIRARGNDGRQDGDPHDHDAGGNFIINLDYRQPAFALGGLEIYDRSSETPQVVQEPYKPPPAPKEGFIRTFAEDDVVLCPMCGDELATGTGDTKQQVWVVKQCGHVYCGDCATNRFSSKARKKDKKAPPSKVIPFSECRVDGCKIKLTHKTAMFPVYL